jgi:putative acetyltransferase
VTLQIRPYRPEDLEAVAGIFRQAVRRTAIRDYSEAQVRAWAPDELDMPAFRERRAKTGTLVAELDGAVVGFTALEPDGHVDMLYVHPDHGGRGAARAMLEAVEARARAAGADRLFTEASLTARPVFERLGYVVLAAQTVERNGERFTNFRMERRLAER